MLPLACDPPNWWRSHEPPRADRLLLAGPRQSAGEIRTAIGLGSYRRALTDPKRSVPRLLAATVKPHADRSLQVVPAGPCDQAALRTRRIMCPRHRPDCSPRSHLRTASSCASTSPTGLALRPRQTAQRVWRRCRPRLQLRGISPNGGSDSCGGGAGNRTAALVAGGIFPGEPGQGIDALGNNIDEIAKHSPARGRATMCLRTSLTGLMLHVPAHPRRKVCRRAHEHPQPMC